MLPGVVAGLLRVGEGTLCATASEGLSEHALAVVVPEFLLRTAASSRRDGGTADLSRAHSYTPGDMARAVPSHAVLHAWAVTYF